MARSKSWSSAIFNYAALNGVDYVYLPLSAPGAITEELVVERVIGDIAIAFHSGADGTYSYDGIQVGVVVLPTLMVTGPPVPPVVQPYIDSDLEWLWAAYVGEQFSVVNNGSVNSGAIKLHCDTGARRRINLSSETLWAVIINGSPIAFKWTAGFRWLGSWA